jgi:hypothetical protein
MELFHSDSEDSGKGWSGSGIIWDIQPDYIYCLSAAHVLDLMTDGFNEIWLYDNTRLTFEKKLSYSQVSAQNELCMFKIPTEMIPMRILRKLREASIDPDIYDKLDSGSQLLGVCINYRHQGKDLVTPMTLQKIGDCVPEYPNSRNFVSATLALRDGMSGTAVIDMHGNLVGVADCMNTRTAKSYALMIDNLDILRQRSRRE